MTIKEELLKETVNTNFKLCQKVEEILEAIEHFKNEGLISPILLQGFTQYGNWIGIHGAEEIEKHSNLLLSHILPKKHRIRTDKDGNTHLLTSYRNLDKIQQIELPYKTIAGSIAAPYCKKLIAKSLTSVGGKVDLEHANEVDLPNLCNVGGFLSLPRIKSVTLPKLSKIDGVLNIYRAKILKAPKLKTIKHIRFENLSTNNKKSILKGLSLKSLNSIKSSTYTTSDLEELKNEINKRKLLENIKTMGNSKRLTIE